MKAHRKTTFSDPRTIHPKDAHRQGRKHILYVPVLLALLALTAAGCGVSFKVQPTVSLSPDTLSWHRVNIGNTSGPKDITVTNTSPAKSVPLSITSVELSPNFIQTDNTCPIAPKVLAPGNSCAISVAFRPVSSGDLTGTLSLVDNATNTPASVALSAKGGVGALLFDPVSLDFSGIAPNTVSQPQTATLTNESTTPVTLAGMTISAHFTEGDNCPAAPNTLAPGGSCTVVVTYNPVSSGTATGVANVKDNLGNSTQLYLTGSDQGTPVASALEFSPTSLVWGKVGVGSTATPKMITVKNALSGGVSFTGITSGPDFTITANTCPVGATMLGGGQTCTVTVAFRPSKQGQVTELLTFNDSATGSPQALSLSGTGTVGDLLFAPPALKFAGVDPGDVSPEQSATLTNETQGNLDLTSITVSGKFAQTNNCPATLGPQASCSFQVTANPTTDGPMTGDVNVKDSAGNSVQLYLSGEGGNTDKVLSFSPDPLTWGTLPVGHTSGAKTLTVNNGQTVPLTITSISVGPDFMQTGSTCPTYPQTVAAGDSCTISLTFRPLSSGAKSEVITFTDDAPGGNQSVALNGTGGVGPLLFNPASLSFAGIAPNTVSQPQTATLTNEQATGVTLASITVSGHFAETNDCPGSLASAASCTVTITSNPVIDGPIEGAVNVKDGSGATTQLYLSGMGGIPITSAAIGENQVTVGPGSLSFGKVMVGQTSGTSTVTFSNRGQKPVLLPSILVGPELHEAANTCPVAPAALPPGAACSISVALRPQSAGQKKRLIGVDRGLKGLQPLVSVTGVGTKGNLSFVPGSLRFAPMKAGSISKSHTVTLTNQSDRDVKLLSIEASGMFAQTNDCPTGSDTLSPGESCTIHVSARPTIAGAFAGSIDVTDGTGAVTQLYLTGLSHSKDVVPAR